MASAKVHATPTVQADLQRAPASSTSLDLQDLEAPVETPEGGPSGAWSGTKLQRAFGNQFVQRLANGNTLQGQRAGGGAAEGGAVSPAVERRIERERGNGQPLPDGTRSSMQRSFGADFSDVRVHTGSESTKLNRSLGARAFTTGTDVFFSEDEYRPETEDGQKLIAHELTHVVQQGGGDASGSAGATAQGKLTVGAADDPFEEEADAVAERAVQPAAPVNRKDEEEETPLAALVTSGSAIQTAIQLEEDIADTSSEDELKQVEDGEGGEGEEGKPDAQEMKRSEDEGAQQGEKEGKQGEEAKAEAEGAVRSQVEEGGASAVGEAADAASGIEMPAEEGGRAETKTAEEIGSDQAAGAALTEESAQQTVDEFSWEAVMPPDWDAEVAFHDAFGAAMEGGVGASPQGMAESALPAGVVSLQRKAAVGGTPRRVQRSSAPGTGTPPPGQAEAAPSPGSAYEGGGYVAQQKEGDVVAVPAHENVFANVVLGDTAGKGAEAINKFAGVGNETNVFGYTAAVLEALILLSESITNILNYIILALAIVAGILYALASALMASVVGAAAGAALLPVASFLTSVVATLGKIVYFITIGRLAARASVIYFRLMDYLYAKATGASAEELKRKLGAMQEQAVGIVIDGVGLLLGGKPAAPGAIAAAPGKYLAKKVAIKGLVYGAKAVWQKDEEAVKEGVKDHATSGGVAGVPFRVASRAEEPAGASASDGGELSVADEANDSQEEEPLPAVPMDAPQKVDAMAEHMAGLQDEKLSLQQRVMTIDDILVAKGQWHQDMGTMQGELASNQQTLKGGDVAMDEQMAVADEFASNAEKADAPSKEAKTSQAQAGGDLQANKGAIGSASQRAESERGGSTQGGDKGQVEGGPAKAEEGAANAERLASQGVQDAQSSKAETQQVKEKSQEAQAITADAQQSVSERQDENLSEIEMLAADKEECLARLAELEGQEADLAAEHQSAVEYAGSWAAQHKETREASPALAGAGAE